MKLVSVARIFCIVIAFSACSGGRGKLDKVNGPDWIFDPYAVNTSKNNASEIAATGISEKTSGGLRMQIAQAEADARVNMANQILSFVARVTRDAMSKQENENNKQEVIRKQFIQVSEQTIRDLNISSASRTHMWQSPDDDTLFVRVAMPANVVKQTLDNAMIAYQEKLKDKDFVMTVDKIRNEITAANNFSTPIMNSQNIAASSSSNSASNK